MKVAFFLSLGMILYSTVYASEILTSGVTWYVEDPDSDKKILCRTGHPLEELMEQFENLRWSLGIPKNLSGMGILQGQPSCKRKG